MYHHNTFTNLLSDTMSTAWKQITQFKLEELLYEHQQPCYLLPTCRRSLQVI